MGFQVGFQIVNSLIALALLGIGIYLFFVLIKFLRLGIEAFQIYIEQNKER